MTTSNGARAFGELERNASEVVEAMRLTGRLLRALAPLAAELRDLQEALLELQESTAPALPAPVAASDRHTNDVTPTAVR